MQSTQLQQPDLNGYELRPEYQLPQHHKIIQWARERQNIDGFKVRYDKLEGVIPLKHRPAFVDNSVGAGKTISIAAAAKHVSERGGRVLIISRGGEIIDQNSKMAWKVGCKNSIFSNSLGQKSTAYPVVFATEGTLANYLTTTFGHNRDGTPRWRPDAIYIDECHEVDWADLVRSYCDPEHTKKTKNQYTRILRHFIAINPNLRIFGFTGSPYRGSEKIAGQFWGEALYEVPTLFLVGLGYLVPPVFGTPETLGFEGYEYGEEFKTTNGFADFSSKELLAMQRLATKDTDKTQRIVSSIIDSTSDFGGVLITCAGKKHCEQVASYLPDGSWGIITDSTGAKERKRILDGARDGSIKYVLQVGCLTTGVNVPIWRYCVILRRIGSLTLLVQLIGRVLRTLEPEQIEAGLVKDNAFVIDYGGTIEGIKDIYTDNDFLSETILKMNGGGGGIPQNCPKCETENSEYAVRCIGADLNEEDGRCGHYFKSVLCLHCNTENAPSAQECRKCKRYITDPNDRLANKAYTDSDYKKVLKMEIFANKSGGLDVVYHLDSTRTEQGITRQEIAVEHYQPFKKDNASRGRWSSFLRSHVHCQKMINGIYRWRSIEQIIHNKAAFSVPTEITHRVNNKGFSVITHKRYLSGRETK